jgi:uncharacterized protein (TIGR02217 family)
MFIDTELDICPGFGWQGGPEFTTRMVSNKAWVERRNANNIQCRHHYTLPLQNITSAQYLLKLKQAFMACRGMLHSFKVKDYSDFEADDEVFGIGDATTTIFQLRKDSIFGIAVYTRIITKPQADIVIKVNGTPTAASVDTLTGRITFSPAPAHDAILAWAGEFRVPVRFNTDILSNSIDNLTGGEEYIMNGSVDLIEVFKE